MDGKAIDNVLEAVKLLVAASLKGALQKLVMRVHQLLCMSL